MNSEYPDKLVNPVEYFSMEEYKTRQKKINQVSKEVAKLYNSRQFKSVSLFNWQAAGIEIKAILKDYYQGIISDSCGDHLKGAMETILEIDRILGDQCGLGYESPDYKEPKE